LFGNLLIDLLFHFIDSDVGLFLVPGLLRVDRDVDAFRFDLLLSDLYLIFDLLFPNFYLLIKLLLYWVYSQEFGFEVLFANFIQRPSARYAPDRGGVISVRHQVLEAQKVP
jgi:hypothetical protein